VNADGSAYWCNLANTIEPSMCGGDVAFCQIILTTIIINVIIVIISTTTTTDAAAIYYQAKKM